MFMSVCTVVFTFVFTFDCIQTYIAYVDSVYSMSFMFTFVFEFLFVLVLLSKFPLLFAHLCESELVLCESELVFVLVCTPVIFACTP